MCQFAASLLTRVGERETGEGLNWGWGDKSFVVMASNASTATSSKLFHVSFPIFHPFSLLQIKIYSVDALSLPNVSKLDDIFNPRMRPEHTLGPPCCRSKGEI